MRKTKRQAIEEANIALQKRNLTEAFNFQNVHNKVLLDLKMKKINKELDATREKIRVMLNNGEDSSEIERLKNEANALYNEWEKTYQLYSS